MARGHHRLLTNSEARAVRKSYRRGAKLSELADEYDVSIIAVYHLVIGRNYKDAGGPIYDPKPKARKPNRDELKREARRLHADGATYSEIAEVLEIGIGTAYRWIND